MDFQTEEWIQDAVLHEQRDAKRREVDEDRPETGTVANRVEKIADRHTGRVAEQLVYGYQDAADEPEEHKAGATDERPNRECLGVNRQVRHGKTIAKELPWLPDRDAGEVWPRCGDAASSSGALREECWRI